MIKEKIIKEIDENSREYDFQDIEPDPRFIQTTKEFWITLIVYINFAALMIGNMLWFGGSNILVLGFPLWIFQEFMLIIGFVIAVIILSTYVYKDMDITSTGELHKSVKTEKEEKRKWILAQTRE